MFFSGCFPDQETTASVVLKRYVFQDWTTNCLHVAAISEKGEPYEKVCKRKLGSCKKQISQFVIIKMCHSSSCETCHENFGPPKISVRDQLFY